MLFATLLGLLAVAVAGAHAGCDVTHEEYHANDGTVLFEVASIVTVKAKCSNGVVPIYATIDGKVYPLTRNADDSLQVSWTTPLEKAGSGSYAVQFYDTETFKKAEYVKFYPGDELFTVNISRSSPYRGPMLEIEVGALFFFLVASYYAIVQRCSFCSDN